MRYALVSILFALVASIGTNAISENEGNKQIWWYHQIFPANFNITFHTPATAHECFRQMIEKVKASPNLGLLSFACSDYNLSRNR
jgi:hypothetical protein